MLTPKEKAEELYDSFFELYPNQDAYFIARQCAKIAVYEIMKHVEESYRNRFIIKGAKLFWINVLNEIDNI